MPQVGLEPAIPANERPQAHALDRAATGMILPWLFIPWRVALPTELSRPPKG